MSDETGTRLDQAFEAVMKSTAVVDALMRKERYDECIKGGGDPLACWLKQGTPKLLFLLAPPPEVPVETALHQALTDMRASVDYSIAGIKACMEKPDPAKKMAAIDPIEAALRTKAIRDYLRRMKEMEECAKGEGDAFMCWVKYRIWAFPFPQPPPPNILEATSSSQAWTQLHSDALELRRAIDLEMEAWAPPG